MSKGWFLTELIFRIHDENCPALYQFDKQMRLIQAATDREAYQNALVTASRELDKQNTASHGQRWEFAGIGMLQGIDRPVQVPSREELVYIDDNSQGREYIHALREQQDFLQMQIALTA